MFLPKVEYGGIQIRGIQELTPNICVTHYHQYKLSSTSLSLRVAKKQLYFLLSVRKKERESEEKERKDA
jgi:hypothetical protein